MASNLYIQRFADGTQKKLRRSIKQGRKSSGLGKPKLYRLFADDEIKLDKLAELFGEYWNESEFVRSAVKEKLCNSVYVELLKT